MRIGRIQYTPRRFDPLIAAAGLALAYAAFLQAFDTALGARNPALAQQVHPLPRSAVRSWMLEALLHPEKLAAPAIVAASREALQQNPSDPEPLRALAFHRNAQGRTAEAEKLARLSSQITRRDELTQLLLTQLAAKDGRPKDALRHLSTAITTTGRGRDAIYELIVPLLVDRTLRSEMAELVAPQNEWMHELLLHALREGGNNPRYVAEILLDARPDQARSVSDKVGPELLSHLAEAGEWQMTRQFFAYLFPGEEALVRNPGITPATSRAALGWLGWTPIEDGASGAQLGTTSGERFAALAYATAGRSGAAVLRRVLMLPPGRYRLRDRRTAIAGGGQLQWAVQCFRAPRWTVQATLTGGPDGGSFTIPADCPMQLIELQAVTTRGGDGVEMTIEDLRIDG